MEVLTKQYCHEFVLSEAEWWIHGDYTIISTSEYDWIFHNDFLKKNNLIFLKNWVVRRGHLEVFLLFDLFLFFWVWRIHKI